MVNIIGTVYHCGLNKGFNLRFCEDSQVQHEMPEEDPRIYQLKHGYNNKDDINSINILSNKLIEYC